MYWTLNTASALQSTYSKIKVLWTLIKFDWNKVTKAELLEEGIFFLIDLFARDVLVMKKLEIEKTKPTFIVSVLKVAY